MPAEGSVPYQTQHTRNVAQRGDAKLYKCVHCAGRGADKQARDWAWVHGTDPDDVMNYIPLCRKCHMAYDPDSGHRVPHTEETKALLSQKNRGYKHTPEAVEKIRATSTGRKHTPESRAKMSAQRKAAAAARGPMPAEQRAKLSEALTGNTNASVRSARGPGAAGRRWRTSSSGSNAAGSGSARRRPQSRPSPASPDPARPPSAPLAMPPCR